MAQPTTVAFGQFWIVVGDGESPELFEAPCGLTSKAFNQTASTQETIVPDCVDPDAPAFVERAVDALSSEISGDGVLAMEAHHNIWQPWLFEAAPRNVRIGLGSIPDPLVGGYYEGPYILTVLNMTADRGQKMRGAVTIQSAAEWEYVPFVVSPPFA